MLMIPKAFSETLTFDEAVKLAFNFAKKDVQTPVIACADHGNGGKSIGNKPPVVVIPS